MKHGLITALLAVAGMLLTAPAPLYAQYMDSDDEDYAAEACPGFSGPNMMTGRGMMMGPGMMRQGMMGRGQMMGPGMMHQGRGAMRGGMMRIRPSLELTAADVETMLNSHLAWRGNDELTLGNVSQESDYIITAGLVDDDGETVRRLEINRQTGRVRPARGR